MEETIYKMTSICAWCEKRPTKNKNYQQYMLRGNICTVCSAEITHKVWQRNYEAEITKRNRDIESLRKEMDMMGDFLDHEITEVERLEIVAKMEMIFMKIRLLKQG